MSNMLFLAERKKAGDMGRVSSDVDESASTWGQPQWHGGALCRSQTLKGNRPDLVRT